MEQRLHKARRNIDKVTKEAYYALVSSNSTIIGNPLPDEPTNDNNDDGAFTTIPDDDEDYQKGMDRGRAIFGSGDDYWKELEEDFRKKLSSVEAELDLIRRGLASLHNGSNGGGVIGGIGVIGDVPMEESNDEEHTLEDMDEDPSSVPRGSIPFTVDEIPQLQRHIQFLQLSADAHKLLDEIDALSFAGYATTATTATTPMTAVGEVGEDGGSNEFGEGKDSSAVSPTSVGTPSSLSLGTFHFEFSSKKYSGGVSPRVQAAQLVKEVEMILERATKMLHESMGERGGEETSNPFMKGENDENKTDNLPMEHSKQNSNVIQMQREILDELQCQTRQKRMEMRHRSITLIEECITIEEGSILVRGTAASPNEAATPRDSGVASNASNRPSLLSDAYQVLELFSDSRFPAFGETLQNALKEMAKKLFRVAMEPCLSKLDSDVEEEESSSLTFFKFQVDFLMNGLPCTDSVSYLNKRKKPAAQLSWKHELIQCSFSIDGSTTDEILDEASNFVLASKLEDSTLSSAPSPDVASFLASLNLLTNFFTFIHHHILLQRSDLARIIGNHLFGPYPLLASPASGSIALGGVVLGNAAQGEVCGEERLLMTEMVKLMKKWCIPSESSPALWRYLKKVRPYLIRVVSAFETKMTEMGLLRVGTNTSDGTVAPKVSTVSSPSGLSVLVDHDNFDSPQHQNMLSPNLSKIESSPYAAPQKQDDVISPLSELAHSLLQVYIESQRTSILNTGRSILLTTDYHNSVQVGTFTPEPAELGTIDSLDNNPLDEFLFQQCHISQTAQKILHLCRKTLDDATHPEAASVIDALPAMLYRTCRELLDLFRAMIPSLYSGEIRSIPRMAAILHNDCVFFAHETSLLGVEYKSKFRSLAPEGTVNKDGVGGTPGQQSKSNALILSEVCTFVDMVVPFRDIATKTMGSMLDVQKVQLHDLIYPRISNFEAALSSNESVTEWDDAETALRASLYHMRHLSQAWSQVLSREIYNLSMGHLVDTIFTLFLNPVLKAEAITEPASRFVHSLFLDAARGAVEMFGTGLVPNTSPLTMQAQSSSADMEKRVKVASKYTTLFEKLEAVGKFMSMRLDDISRALGDGVFRKVTARELSHLIAAAFDESPKRTAMLNSLASK